MNLKNINSFILLLIGFLVCLSASGLSIDNSVKIQQWEVYEIELVATGIYQNPYVEASVTATLQGPGNATKIVTGFWDGGNKFLVRFTPTERGIWKYLKNISNDVKI